MAVCSVRFLACAVALLPLAARAQSGWADLPRVWADSILFLIYVRAREYIGVLLVLTALALAYRVFVGAKRGNTQSDSDESPPFGSRQSELEKLEWLLARLYIVLSALTALALLVIAAGKSAGLEYVKPVRTDAADFRSLETPRIVWNGRSPNLKPWPKVTGYIPDMVVAANNGRSVIVLDNSQGTTPLYAKLCEVWQRDCNTRRHVFVQAASTMTLADVSMGTYEIRFVDLTTRLAARTSRIEIALGATESFEFNVGARGPGDEFKDLTLEEF
jgi:hypothetical protein